MVRFEGSSASRRKVLGLGVASAVAAGYELISSAESAVESSPAGNRGPGTPFNVKDYGAAGDGKADDTAAFTAAIKAAPAGATILVPNPSVAYRLVSTVTVTKPVNIRGDNAKIKVDIPNAATTTALINVTSSDVNIAGLWFDGSHKRAGDVPGGNRYCIRALGRSDTARLGRVNVRHCRFTALNVGWFAGTKIQSTPNPNLLVVHGAYFDWVSDCHFNNNHINELSGSACFMRHAHHTTQNQNYVKDTGWYSLHYDGGDRDFEVAGNKVIGDAPDIRFWGSSIDIMGQNAYGPSKFGEIHHNYIAGVHNYGNAGGIRLSSCAHVSVHHNVFDRVRPGKGASSSYVANPPCIVVVMRQVVATVNGPSPKYLRIHDNDGIAGCVGQPFVLAQNGTTAAGKGMIEEAVGLKVQANDLDSPNARHYFACVLQLHGQNGGWRKIRVNDNVCQGKPQTGGSLQGGMVNFTGLRGNPVKDVVVKGNQLRYVDQAGGRATIPAHAGVLLGGYVDGVIVKSNTLRGFWHQIRATTHSGPHLDLYDNMFLRTVSQDVLLDKGVRASRHQVSGESGTVFLPAGAQTGPRQVAGSGSPEGLVAAPIGSVFHRTDGAAGTSMYVKESGAGTTGWVGK